MAAPVSKHPTTWRYITLDQLPSYEAEGWRAMAHYKSHEEFSSLLVGWFGEGSPPKVKDE